MNEELYTGCLARECEDFILDLQCECTKVMNSLGWTKIKSLELEYARAKLLDLFLEIIYQAITETDNELVNLCNEIDEDAFIVDFKDLLKKYGISSVHVNIFKHDNL